MSLVAYGSSDEESDEEVQNSQDDVEKPSSAKEEKYPGKGKGLVLPSPKQKSDSSNSSSGKTALSSFLPKPKNVNNLERENIDNEAQPISDNKTFPVSLESLPEDEEILEIEEEYEPIAKRAKKVTNSEVGVKPRSVGSLFSLLPAPWKADNTWQSRKKDSKTSVAEERKSKQPIKISIPTAPKVKFKYKYVYMSNNYMYSRPSHKQTPSPVTMFLSSRQDGWTSRQQKRPHICY